MPGTLARLRLGPFVAVLSLALGVQVSSQAALPPTASRCVLLFFDDLHMAFRDTPRVRNVAKSLIQRTMQPGDLWAIVSTGTSSVSQAPTSDQSVILAMVSRIIGNRLTPNEVLLDRRRSGGPVELRHRAEISYATATVAIEQLPPCVAGRFIVLHFSLGYDLESVPEPAAVIAAAARARAQIHTIDTIAWAGRQDPPLPPELWADWDAYLESTKHSLLMLAAQTG